MGRILKSRVTIGILSIILALVLSFGVTPLLNQAMESQVEIIKAIKTIEKGEKITADKITKIKVGQYNLEQEVIKDSDAVIGKYATTDIYKGDFFLPSKISDVKGKENYYLYDVEKNTDHLAVSITIKTVASGLSEKLKSGDIISIISSIDHDVEPTVIPELRYVEVLAVTNKAGQDIGEKREEDELTATIVLSVTELQAEKLVFHEQQGDIHIALVHRGDKKIAREYLELQKEYFNDLLEEKTDEIEEAKEKDDVDQLEEQTFNEGGKEENEEEKNKDQNTQDTDGDNYSKNAETSND